MSVLSNTHLLLPATELAQLKSNAFKGGGVRGSSDTVGENSSFISIISTRFIPVLIISAHISLCKNSIKRIRNAN